MAEVFPFPRSGTIDRVDDSADDNARPCHFRGAVDSNVSVPVYDEAAGGNRDSFLLRIVRRLARYSMKPFRADLSVLFWFGTFRKCVKREADLLVATHGPLAYRYARDHIRFAESRRNKRDARFYIAVAEDIAARDRATKPAACAAGRTCLSEFMPALHLALAALA